VPKTWKVLVSGATGDVAQGVLKALGRSSIPVELYTTCVHADCAFLHNGYQSFLAPYSASEEYLPFLLDLLGKFAIDLFIPTVDSEILKIAQNRQLIESSSPARVFVGEPEKIRICEDKVATAAFLKQHGFVYPRTIGAEDPEAENFLHQVGLPVIVKPKRGRGSHNVFLRQSYSEALIHLGDKAYCYQEWLPADGGEFTTGIYLGDDKEVKGICTLQRELKGGSTFKARRLIAPELEEPLKLMAQKLDLKYVNIQSRRVNDSLVPFEFNGRFSGTTGIISRVFNAPELVIKEWLLGQTVPPASSEEQFVAMRYYEEVYATPDDLQELEERSQAIVSRRRL
jgi:hypothetical protein